MFTHKLVYALYTNNIGDPSTIGTYLVAYWECVNLSFSHAHFFYGDAKCFPRPFISSLINHVYLQEGLGRRMHNPPLPMWNQRYTYLCLKFFISNALKQQHDRIRKHISSQVAYVPLICFNFDLRHRCSINLSNQTR